MSRVNLNFDFLTPLIQQTTTETSMPPDQPQHVEWTQSFDGTQVLMNGQQQVLTQHTLMNFDEQLYGNNG